MEPLPPASITEGMTSNVSRTGFEEAVLKAKEHIARGDAFQVVLSQEFRRPVTVDPFQVYRVLRALNPSPYLFYLSSGDTALFGSSPETLVKVEGRTVSVRPIAGTRRGAKTSRRTGAWRRSSSPTRRSWPSTACWSTWAGTTWAAWRGSARCA